jgi:hypothetical protein
VSSVGVCVCARVRTSECVHHSVPLTSLSFFFGAETQISIRIMHVYMDLDLLTSPALTFLMRMCGFVCRLCRLGFVWQFVTLAGFHLSSLNANRLCRTCEGPCTCTRLVIFDYTRRFACSLFCNLSLFHSCMRCFLSKDFHPQSEDSTLQREKPLLTHTHTNTHSGGRAVDVGLR